MDKNEPNFNYSPYSPYGGFDIGADPMLGDNPMFNPVMQYEQAYMYYRYLTQQMEYKIKCKEYERMTGGKSERRVE
ncbi:MAG: hypothetical protein IJ777_01530 [Clostridia bacterium]|nr:hypothetical protein [Clostridia bacterium]